MNPVAAIKKWWRQLFPDRQKKRPFIQEELQPVYVAWARYHKRTIEQQLDHDGKKGLEPFFLWAQQRTTEYRMRNSIPPDRAMKAKERDRFEDWINKKALLMYVSGGRTRCQHCGSGYVHEVHELMNGQVFIACHECSLMCGQCMAYLELAARSVSLRREA